MAIKWNPENRPADIREQRDRETRIRMSQEAEMAEQRERAKMTQESAFDEAARLFETSYAAENGETYSDTEYNTGKELSGLDSMMRQNFDAMQQLGFVDKSISYDEYRDSLKITREDFDRYNDMQKDREIAEPEVMQDMTPGMASKGAVMKMGIISPLELTETNYMEPVYDTGNEGTSYTEFEGYDMTDREFSEPADTMAAESAFDIPEDMTVPEAGFGIGSEPEADLQSEKGPGLVKTLMSTYTRSPIDISSISGVSQPQMDMTPDEKTGRSPIDVSGLDFGGGGLDMDYGTA